MCPDMFILVALYLNIAHSTCSTSCPYNRNPISSFSERVGPRIISLENVDYFGTINYFSGRKKRTISTSKTSRFTGKAGSRIEDRGSRIKDQGSKIKDRGWRMEDRGSRIGDRGLRIG